MALQDPPRGSDRDGAGPRGAGGVPGVLDAGPVQGAAAQGAHRRGHPAHVSHRAPVGCSQPWGSARAEQGSAGSASALHLSVACPASLSRLLVAVPTKLLTAVSGDVGSA